MNKDPIPEMFTEKQLLRHIADANSGGDYARWKSVRHFVTNAMYKDGSFLDIGCANGFFLLCMQRWSTYAIAPYGIDNRQEVIAKAKLLMPDDADHFDCIDGDNLKQLKQSKLPNTYDYVYRNYWKGNIDSDYVRSVTDTLWNHVSPNGRLILGAYWGGNHPMGSDAERKSKESFVSFIDIIKEGAGTADGEAFSPSGFHWIMWIDKK